MKGDTTWRMEELSWHMPPSQNSRQKVSCIAQSKGYLSPLATRRLNDSFMILVKGSTLRLGLTEYMSLSSKGRLYPVYIFLGCLASVYGAFLFPHFLVTRKNPV